MSKRTHEIVDKPNAKKIKKEEINNESTSKFSSVNLSTKEEFTNRPSTSKEINTAKEQNEDNNPTKQLRKPDYNFWMKINKPNDVNKNKPVENIKIEQLHEGKMYETNLILNFHLIRTITVLKNF